MSVFKDKNGVWGFKIRIDGKQIKKISKNWTKKQALEEERKFINEYAPNSETITLNQVYNMMMKEYDSSLKESSKEVYRKLFTKLEPLHNKPISEIEPKDIKKWQMSLVSSVGGESLKKVQNLLKRLIRYAYANDLIDSDKLANFKSISSMNTGRIKQCEFYTLEQYNKLVSVVERKDDLMMYRLLFYTGCRIGELRALQVQHFRDNKITIEQNVTPNGKVVSTPKTSNSYRVVVLDKTTTDMLKSYCESLDADDYICSRCDVIPYYDAFRKRHAKYCEKANLPYINIHGFRHSHVSMLINKGFSAHDIANRIGDTVTMVNEIYGHLYEDSQERIAAALD